MTSPSARNILSDYGACNILDNRIMYLNLYDCNLMTNFQFIEKPLLDDIEQNNIIDGVNYDLNFWRITFENSEKIFLNLKSKEKFSVNTIKGWDHVTNYLLVNNLESLSDIKYFDENETIYDLTQTEQDVLKLLIDDYLKNPKKANNNVAILTKDNLYTQNLWSLVPDSNSEIAKDKLQIASIIFETRNLLTNTKSLPDKSSLLSYFEIIIKPLKPLKM
eukprot:Pgem_evm2s127